MLNPADLVRDEALVRPAIEQCQASADDLAAALAKELPPAQLAALAIVAGLRTAAPAQPALIALLDRDDVAGRAAAWALANLDSEAAVLGVLANGGLDVRENAYRSLATRAAMKRASAGLNAALRERVAAENDRAKRKLTGLGEHALRVLAILGDPETASLIEAVTEADPYTDRFELQRLRKQMGDKGRDSESASQLAAPWHVQFADQLAATAEPAPAAAPAPAPAAPAPPPSAATPLPSTAGAGDADDELADGEAGAPQPVDWAAFAASPEIETLPPQARQLAGQLGPLLEQLAARALNAPLADLTGQELAALLLQVLPQAMPPQHVQAALSPQAINAYQAMAKWLTRTGAATHGNELVQAVKLVRQQLQQQIRQSGILGGPDYSDPDEAPSPVALS